LPNLELFRATPSGREKPGRYWKHDLEKIEPPQDASAGGRVTFASADARIIVRDLEAARRETPELLAQVSGKAIGNRKFAYLTLAFSKLGAFIHVPAGVQSDEPITITYYAKAGETVFPHTVVFADSGSRATIIERLEVESGAFVCGIAEVVTGSHADITFASKQQAPDDARVLYTRAAKPGRDARVAWACADLGGALAMNDTFITIDEPGVDANIATLFFPTGSQHVDVVTTVDHRVGDAQSNTLVKTAANGSGQGRYLGNIRIAKDAQHSKAALRDDALLLSKRAHIDSIPALEIAANDVKAYHGATVGALDDDAIFYMTTRGLERQEAERMIALGFFEPVIDAFPGEALREELRAAVAIKMEQA
jgi:Fe-S cluster assembly protein SufD